MSPPARTRHITSMCLAAHESLRQLGENLTAALPIPSRELPGTGASGLG